MSVLHVYPSEGALEAALERALQGRDEIAVVEVGRGWTSTSRLLREASPPAISPRAERLLAREAKRPDGEAHLAGRLLRVWSALRQAGVDGRALRGIAPKLVGRPGDDVRWLADGLVRYEAALAERVDGGAALREALRAIASGTVASLRDVDEVFFHATPLAPLDRALVEALAERGCVVRVVALAIADDERGAPAYRDALREAATLGLARLEAIATSRVEASRRDVAVGVLPSVLAAATPALEARAVARRVRDAIAAGMAPDEIAVVADDTGRRAAILRALRAYEVPVEAPARAALDAGATRTALALLRLLDDAQPRDRFADLLASRYLEGGVRTEARWISGRRVARFVMQTVPAGADARAIEAALADAGRAGRDDEIATARHARALWASLTALPRQATLARHAAAFSSLCERTQLFSLARGFRRGGPPSPHSLAAEAIARDQAGLHTLSDVLDDLPRAAAQAGLMERVLPRAEWIAILTDELSDAALPAGGGRGAAVHVCASSALLAMQPKLLVLAGAEEGALPSVTEEDPVLPEETRRVLERAVGRELLPSPASEEARARLALAVACAHASDVVLTWSRVDAAGSPTLCGAIVEDARARGAIEERGNLAMVPALAELRTHGELLARLAAETHAAAGGLAPSARERARTSLLAWSRPRVLRVERSSAIERGRARFFAGDAEAGIFDGRIADATVRAALRPPLPGGTRALSATTLQRYVECSHRFFLEDVLRLRPTEEQGGDLDPRASGNLRHRALERLFRAWLTAGVFPLRGTPAELAHIDAVVGELAETWDGPRGHAPVWAVHLRSLRVFLEALWRKEVAEPAAPGHVPTELELSFDGLRVEGLDGEDGVLLGGRIDRVDLSRAEDGTLRAAVFDYKSGAISRFTAELKEDAFAESSWQLPIYAAAVRAQLGAGDVRMHYYSLRHLEIRGSDAPRWLSFGRGDDPEAPTLGDHIARHVRAMRDGRFEVAPRADACARCGMQAACRVVERRVDEDEGER